METELLKLCYLLYFPFYPTYEEWKHKSPSVLAKASYTFYPTYEEWKLIPNPPSASPPSCLFILPMRNGNYQLTILDRHEFLLFILPMRNGNMMVKIMIKFQLYFLSYL